MRAHISRLLHSSALKGTVMKYFALVLVVLTAGCVTKEMGNVRDMPIKDVDLKTVTNGEHAGAFTYGGFTYQVVTTVTNHEIARIDIVQNKKSRHAAKAEAVIPLIVQHQTPNVDGISGASISSKALQKAVENSLMAGQR